MIPKASLFSCPALPTCVPPLFFFQLCPTAPNPGLPCSFSHILLLICLPASPFHTTTFYSSASLYFANLNVPCTTCPFSWPSNVSKPANLLHASLHHRSFAWFLFICLPACLLLFLQGTSLPACMLYSFSGMVLSACVVVQAVRLTVVVLCNGVHMIYPYTHGH